MLLLSPLFPILLFSTVLTALVSSTATDDPLGTPEGYLKYDIKKGASFNPEYESVGYWNGSVYGWTYDSDGRSSHEKLFLFEGFNIRSVRMSDDGGHYISLSREVSVYRDKLTGDVLVAWTNSYTGEQSEVFPVENDPVNALIYPEVGMYSYYDSHTNFALDVLLEYPNPLQPGEYPEYSSGENYIGGELFLHFTKTQNLFDEALTEVGYLGSWSRFGPFLPWFELGPKEGGCLYNAPFYKLDSVDSLPKGLYLWTVENFPDYLHPPRNYSSPNLTSWRVFKNRIDERRAAGEEDIQVPEQPEKSEVKEPEIDPDVLNHLVDLGWMSSEFEGTSYYVFDGQTGYDLFWMSGELETKVMAGDDETWEMEIKMTGVFSTPWPDKEPVSGGEWYGPEGGIVQVPYINTSTQIQVSAEVCSTGHVTLDTSPYYLLNCELLLDTEVLFITLYVSPGNQVIGGVTNKRQFEQWLN